jgi:hypothetical protein
LCQVGNDKEIKKITLSKKTSFLGDASRFDIGWRVWFWLLPGVNILAPLFFLGRLESWITLSASVLAAVVVVSLHRRLGWVRLLGIGHFPWIGLVPWLVSRYLTTSPGGVFATWMLAVIFIDSACLAIDFVDVLRYLGGDRTPIVSSGKLSR